MAKKTVPNLTNSPTYVQHAVRAARTLALRYGQDREIVLAEFSLDGTGCRLVLSRYSETRVDWLKDFAKTRYCYKVGTWTSTVYSTFISVNPGYTSPYRDGDESSPLMESGNRVGRWFETKSRFKQTNTTQSSLSPPTSFQKVVSFTNPRNDSQISFEVSTSERVFSTESIGYRFTVPHPTHCNDEPTRLLRTGNRHLQYPCVSDIVQPGYKTQSQPLSIRGWSSIQQAVHGKQVPPTFVQIACFVLHHPGDTYDSARPQL